MPFFKKLQTKQSSQRVPVNGEQVREALIKNDRNKIAEYLNNGCLHFKLGFAPDNSTVWHLLRGDAEERLDILHRMLHIYQAKYGHAVYPEELNIRNAKGQAPIHRTGPKTVDILTRFGADPTLLDHKNRPIKDLSYHLGRAEYRRKPIFKIAQVPDNQLGQLLKINDRYTHSVLLFANWPMTKILLQQERLNFEFPFFYQIYPSCTSDIHHSYSIWDVLVTNGKEKHLAFLKKMLQLYEKIYGHPVGPAELNVTDDEGVITPLLKALNRGNFEAACILIEHGANPLFLGKEALLEWAPSSAEAILRKHEEHQALVAKRDLSVQVKLNANCCKQFTQKIKLFFSPNTQASEATKKEQQPLLKSSNLPKYGN